MSTPTTPTTSSAVLRRLDDRPWRDACAPADVLRVPTMLSDRELALLYTLGRDVVRPEVGAIVDAGCFLGGSSSALLAGLRDRPEPWTGPELASYDLFKVEAYELTRWFSHLPSVQVDDSFRPYYDRLMAPYHGVPHRVLEGDITTIGWTGEPIQLFFVDVLKAPFVNRAVQREFYPHLVPGESIMIQQDYGYGAHPYIHIGVELMGDSVRHVDLMPHGSHVFAVERALPPEAIEVDPHRDLSFDEQCRLMDRAIGRWTGDTRGYLELAKATLIFDHVGAADALDYVEDVRSRYGGVGIHQCADITRDGFTMLSGGRVGERRGALPAPPRPADPAPPAHAGDLDALLADRPWKTLQVPQAVTAVPTQMSDRELAILYTLARDFAEPGGGALVDVGAFLGASSSALLAGLADRPEPWTGPPVVSYDRFVGQPWMPAGDGSIRERYDASVGQFDAPHEVHEGDLEAIAWTGGPIQVLFLDAIWTAEVHDAVQRAFFGHLVPGRSIIVHRGYGYGQGPWNQIGIELMGDAVRPIDRMPHTTHAFLVERPLPPEAVSTRLTTLGAGERLRLIDRSIERLDGQARGMAELSKALVVAEHAGLQDALDLVADVRRRYGLQVVATCADATRDRLLATGAEQERRGPGPRRWAAALPGGRAIVGLPSSAVAGAPLNRVLDTLGVHRDGEPERVVPTWLARLNDEVVGVLQREFGSLPTVPGWERLEILDDVRDRAREALASRFADAPVWSLADPRLLPLLPFWQPLLLERAASVAYVLYLASPADVDGDWWLDAVTRALEATAGEERLLVFGHDLREGAAGEIARLAALAGVPAPRDDVVARLAAELEEDLAGLSPDRPAVDIGGAPVPAHVAFLSLQAAGRLRRATPTPAGAAMAESLERSVDLLWRTRQEHLQNEAILEQAVEVMDAAAEQREQLDAEIAELRARLG
jgi:hypothetical protein